MQPHPHDSEPCPAPAPPIRRLLLFCGSRTGADPRHAATARAVGRLLGRRGVTLVYGGGALGLMGELARAARAAGGRVEGVIPRFLLDLEVAEPQVSELIVVETLHLRKAEMFARADAVLALPGGIGTLDEVVELLSWRMLGLHAKPLLLLGDGGFWQPLLALVDHLVRAGFAPPHAAAALVHLPGLRALEGLLPAA
ncbi:LOG family protein [Thermaurantiacus sp.]